MAPSCRMNSLLVAGIVILTIFHTSVADSRESWEGIISDEDYSAIGVGRREAEAEPEPDDYADLVLQSVPDDESDELDEGSDSGSSEESAERSRRSYGKGQEYQQPQQWQKGPPPPVIVPPKVPHINPGVCSGVGPKIDILFAHPTRCDKYIQCVHEKPMVRDCGPGTYWDPRAKECGYWQNSYCAQEMQIKVPTTTCTCNDFVIPPPISPPAKVVQPWEVRPTVRPIPPVLPGINRPVIPVQPPPPPVQPPRPPVQPPRPPVQPPPPSVIHVDQNICRTAGPKIDVLFAHPNRCDKYVQCVHGQPMVRECGPGTYWDPRAKHCGHWRDSYCSLTMKIPHPTQTCNCNNYILPPTTPTSPAGGGQVPAPPAPRPLPQPIPRPLPQPIPRPQPLPERPVSPHVPKIVHVDQDICVKAGPRTDVLFAHPERCDKYIQCVHGRPMVRECGPGTFWDPRDKNCGFWHSSYCSTQMKIQLPTAQCRCNDFKVHPHSQQSLVIPSYSVKTAPSVPKTTVPTLDYDEPEPEVQ